MTRDLKKRYFQTLKQAYLFLDETKDINYEQVNTLNNTFLSIDFIERLDDDELYISILKSIVSVGKKSYNGIPKEKEFLDRFYESCISLKRNFNLADEEERKRYIDSVEYFFKNYVSKNQYNLRIDTFNKLYPLFEDKEKANEIINILCSYLDGYASESERKMKITTMITDYAQYSRQYFKKEDIFYKVLLAYVHNTGNRNYDSWFDNNLCSRLFRSLVVNSAEEKEEGKKSKELSDLELINTIKYKLAEELAFNKISRNRNYDNIGSYLAEKQIWLFQKKDRAEADVQLETSDGIISTKRVPEKKDFSVKSSFLNSFAYNMTTNEYITNPAIAREEEIRNLQLILISPKKSPILLGEAGVGKTSVVEGLAYCLINGNVPDLLKDRKIFKLTTQSLIAGACYVGDPEKRVQQLISELEEHKDVILFIDEIHTIMGAGSATGKNNDVANMLKPHIDRGRIKIIGATTSEEYQKFIAKDKALARRFYSIFVNEPNFETTKHILMGTIPTIENATKVHFNFSDTHTDIMLQHLIEASDIQNQDPLFLTHRPELPLTLLEMSFSYAALDSRNNLGIEDVYNAIYYCDKLKSEKRQESAIELKLKLR